MDLSLSRPLLFNLRHYFPQKKCTSSDTATAFGFRVTRIPNGFSSNCPHLSGGVWANGAQNEKIASKTRVLSGEKQIYAAKQVTKTDNRRNSSNRKKKRGEKESAVSGRTGYGFWRLFNVEIPFEMDPGKDDFSLHDPLMDAIALALSCRASRLPRNAFTLVRKSLDARKEPKFVYTLDIDVKSFMESESDASNILSVLKPTPGKYEFSSFRRAPMDIVTRLENTGAICSDAEEFEQTSVSENPSKPPSYDSDSSTGRRYQGKRAKIIVVGSGPAGLFAALSLVESGVEVTLLERGQPVEVRGRHIGALMARKLLNPNSNLCYGEGGAGTWSDGKLTTRIGKNSSSVQTVLATLVRFGAPPQIMVDGKPHIGTDKLVRILQNLRHHLESHGAKILFGTKMEDLEIKAGRVTGVRVSRVDNVSVGYEVLEADAVVLGVGHSARDVYEKLLCHNVALTAKPFAVGFRVEHPQELINELQVGIHTIQSEVKIIEVHAVDLCTTLLTLFASEVQKGKGRLPVADYKLAADGSSLETEETAINDGPSRGCFSFCMCPGGQVVLTSTNPTELCINGMSFSRRSSRWANAALVVSVDPSDFSAFGYRSGPLAGVAFQKGVEQEAAIRGGGNFVVPVQTVTDFLDDRLSEAALPTSSYRLGVRAAALHDLLPSNLTISLKNALLNFERQLPGFIDKRGLLHGVETRTSAPVRIERDEESFESISLAGLYPIGEGAGHAGGIVSAAVDGMRVGLALSKAFSDNILLHEIVLEA